MNGALPRVVCDCQVLLQAALNAQGPAGRCLELAQEGHVELCVSEATLAEAEDVLRRPELQRRFTRLTPALVNTFLERLREFATTIDEVPARFTYERDPKDEPYLNLAIAAAATYLVSRDKDLLDLQPETSAEGERLRVLVPGLIILDPVGFLRAISH